MKYSGGFSFDATKNSIKLTRYDENKNIKTYILNKNNFFALKPQDGDKIEIFNNLELKEKPYIYVHGKVLEQEIKYNYFEGMKLSQLFDMVTFRSEIVQKEDKEDKRRESLFVDKNNIKIIRNNDDNKRAAAILKAVRLAVPNNGNPTDETISDAKEVIEKYDLNMETFEKAIENIK